MFSFNTFLLFSALFLVVLVLLVCCMFVPDACCEYKGTQFESCKDEEMQEQELKTLSSYYMDLRQVYSLIIFCPNNIYFTACMH